MFYSNTEEPTGLWIFSLNLKNRNTQYPQKLWLGNKFRQNLVEHIVSISLFVSAPPTVIGWIQWNCISPSISGQNIHVFMWFSECACCLSFVIKFLPWVFAEAFDESQNLYLDIEPPRTHAFWWWQLQLELKCLSLKCKCSCFFLCYWYDHMKISVRFYFQIFTFSCTWDYSGLSFNFLVAVIVFNEKIQKFKLSKQCCVKCEYNSPLLIFDAAMFRTTWKKRSWLTGTKGHARWEEYIWIIFWFGRMRLLESCLACKEHEIVQTVLLVLI